MTSGARNMLGVLEKLEGPDIKVHQMRCIDVRNRNAGCHACADACTSGAIGFEDGLITVASELCIGCGTCATACPTCALEARHPEDADLLASCKTAIAANDGELVVLCTRNADAAFGRYDEARVVEVTCLGRIDESLLAQAAAAGCTAVHLVTRGCEACEHVAGYRVACEVAATTAALLEAWRAPIEINLAESLPESVRVQSVAGKAQPMPAPAAEPQAMAAPGTPGNPPEASALRSTPCVSHQESRPQPGSTPAPAAVVDPAGSEGCSGRSGAAGGAGEDCLSTGATSETDPRPLPAKVGRDGTLAHVRSTRRGLLAEALNTVGEAAETTVTSRLWGTVSIDTDACGSCRMCAVFCPTGALRKFDDRATGTFGIDHTPAHCVRCRCCEAVCPKGAISVASEVFAPDIVDGHVERFEMRPREIEPGKPTTVVNKMRKLLVGSQFVNFA